MKSVALVIRRLTIQSFNASFAGGRGTASIGAIVNNQKVAPVSPEISAFCYAPAELKSSAWAYGTKLRAQVERRFPRCAHLAIPLAFTE